MPKPTRTFVADFETTVYKGQTHTEVWAAASVEMFTEDVFIFHSIAEMFRYYVNLKCNVRVYFHNLKFDGNFWLSFFMVDLGLKQATIRTGTKEFDFRFAENREMDNKTFKYSISEMGQWYTITVRIGGNFITFQDSLKLLPFSVEKIGKDFGTKHRKKTMEYEGVRYAGCEITKEEREYIKNDVLVVKEALEIMYSEGHKKLTIGSCCLAEFKKLFMVGFLKYDVAFPNMYEIPIDDSYRPLNYIPPETDEEKEREEPYTAGDYIRRSYRGGWCYLVKGKENRLYHNGTTADVNSLYPSVMHSDSGSYYPMGKPVFWKGNYIPKEALMPERYYFVRIRTRFRIKQGKLPFVQIKSSRLYKATECLETSDVYSYKDGKYYETYVKDGIIHDTRVELTLTMTDYILLQEHYDLIDFEILDGCWFFAEIGIFDSYINKYRELKLNSTGSKKQLAKLFLNNLYGKMATSTDSSFKYAYVKEDKSIGFVQVSEHDKTPGYIPIGSAITSYARNFTIRAAQKNYHGVNKKGFIYADTDSIHCDLPPDKIKGITVHDKNFNCWKLESCWDVAVFTRQKTYIEHITHENLKPVEKPYNQIKCAGMPDNCKNLLELSLTGKAVENGYKNEEGEIVEREWNDAERDFLFDEEGKPIIRTYWNFRANKDNPLCIPGKLVPRRIPGGVLLVEISYEMR